MSSDNDGRVMMKRDPFSGTESESCSYLKCCLMSAMRDGGEMMRDPGLKGKRKQELLVALALLLAEHKLQFKYYIRLGIATTVITVL